jgi:hypothetical protein
VLPVVEGEVGMHGALVDGAGGLDHHVGTVRGGDQPRILADGEHPARDGARELRGRVDDSEGTLNALRRPTVGVEGDGDDPAPFDPHYFIGTWRIEGVLPESPLGPSGDFVGTETIRHVEGCTYEGTLEATQGGESFRVESRMVYDRREHYLVRTEIDSRGSTIMKIGPMRGDPGGFTSHHWIAPAIEQAGTVVRMSGRTFVSSPYAYRLRMEMAIDDEPSMNFGTLWWERVED